MLTRIAERGLTLIEMMIGLALVALLLFLGVPAFTSFLQNTQIRDAAETTLQGINLARTSAVRLNTYVRFQFVNNLTASCALSTSSPDWVVSLADPSGLCNVAAVGGNALAASVSTTDPQIIQEQSAAQGSPNVSVAATGGSSVVFNGLGRVVGTGITQIDFSNPAGGTCQYLHPNTGTMRCLRVQIESGGQTKLCDPQVTDTTDPRVCD